MLAVAATLEGCSTATGARAADTGYTIGLGHVHGLGRVLVDARGMTLYLYTPDHRGASKCYKACAAQWPPLVAEGKAARPRLGPGVDRALVGTVRRSDGQLQLTYDGWPLYTYRLGRTPGTAPGQGEDMGLWLVISPAGRAVP